MHPTSTLVECRQGMQERKKMTPRLLTVPSEQGWVERIKYFKGQFGYRAILSLDRNGLGESSEISSSTHPSWNYKFLWKSRGRVLAVCSCNPGLEWLQYNISILDNCNRQVSSGYAVLSTPLFLLQCCHLLYLLDNCHFSFSPNMTT